MCILWATHTLTGGNVCNVVRSTECNYGGDICCEVNISFDICKYIFQQCIILLGMVWGDGEISAKLLAFLLAIHFFDE